jgi:hypothetical protein
MEDRVDLLVTVVLAAADEQAATRACHELQWNVDGRIVESADCSAEEPGCWSVTMRVPTEERATQNVGAPLARAVRQFVRNLGPGFDTPRVACEPPTAWTVLDDPDALGTLVTGAERLLVEAWYGEDPYPPAPAPAEPAWPEEDEPVTTPRPHAAHRLWIRVDVATDRASGAQWQARAVAGRVTPHPRLTEVTEANGVVSVCFDLGGVTGAPTQAVRDAAAALEATGWSDPSVTGETAFTEWIAQPRPVSGITALALSSGPETHQRKQ